MQNLKPINPLCIRTTSAYLASGLLLTLWFSGGCGGATKNPATTSTPVTVQPGPQSYLAPAVAGAVGLAGGLSSFTIDDTADTFSQTSYVLDPPVQQGPQVLNAGVVAVSSRGLRSLGITANYVANSGSNGVPPGYYPVTYDPPMAGSFGLELAARTGGLVQLVGQPAQPLVAATQCPSFPTPQTYQFITIPAALVPPNTVPANPDTWDPTSETAYGTVDISSTGETVTFQNIHQYTLPSVGGTGAPAFPSASSVSGLCGSTLLGNIVKVPGQLIITNPGNGQSTPYQASIGIGASNGLLVEDNNNSDSGTSATGLTYENVLGAGTGAVGLPQPSSPLSTGDVIGAQYQGFIYAAGVFNSNSWSSHLASFGFANVPARCAALTPATGTLIYGGDFTNDDPSTSPNGYGNCDFAIDLGAQSPSSNGLYPNATIWVGAGYSANSTGATYSFPAVAIAGQVGSKFALFLIAVDSTQPWAIYLLQSN